MNRLQKKCVIATAGIHLLLLTILIVGPAFFNPKSKPDDSQVLDVIPPNLIDAAFNSGVKNAQPPAPALVVQPQPQPVQPTPKPIVAPAPTPTFAQRVEKFFTEQKTDLTPIEKSSSPKKIDLTPVVRTVPKNSTTPNQQEISKQQKLRQQEFQKAIRNLKNNFTPGTTIDMPGNSSVAYANYASVVKSIYDAAWKSQALTLPGDIADKNETVKVTITIARDGTVVSAHMIAPSGDAALDASVQRALDRVNFIAPFSDGMTEKEWTRTISFNPELENLSE